VAQYVVKYGKWYYLVQVSGHFDYEKQMDVVLEVVGVRTRDHAELGTMDSLRQWTAVQRSEHSESPAISTVTSSSQLADSALGDEVDEAVEAFEYMDMSEDSVQSENWKLKASVVSFTLYLLLTALWPKFPVFCLFNVFKYLWFCMSEKLYTLRDISLIVVLYCMCEVL